MDDDDRDFWDREWVVDPDGTMWLKNWRPVALEFSCERLPPTQGSHKDITLRARLN